MSRARRSFSPSIGADVEDVSSGFPTLLARLVGTDPPQDATGGSSSLQEATGLGIARTCALFLDENH
eukprot:9484846-Pyramimonas_sp.AAC.1